MPKSIDRTKILWNVLASFGLTLSKKDIKLLFYLRMTRRGTTRTWTTRSVKKQWQPQRQRLLWRSLNARLMFVERIEMQVFSYSHLMWIYVVFFHTLSLHLEFCTNFFLTFGGYWFLWRNKKMPCRYNFQSMYIFQTTEKKARWTPTTCSIPLLHSINGFCVKCVLVSFSINLE